MPLPEFPSAAPGGRPTRREVLAAAAAGGASIILGGAATRQTRGAAPAPTPQPTAPQPPVKWLEPCPPEAWKKQGVVLAPAEPWEGKYIQNFNSTAEPLGGGRWRLWYGLNSPEQGPHGIAVAEGVPGEPMTRTRAVFGPGEPADAPLSVGNLPQGWQPVQPVHLHLKSGKHRLYFWAHGPGVQRFLAAESDDGRRYRVLDPLRPCLHSPADRAVRFKGVSKWGLRNPGWARPAAGEPEASPDLVTNDGATVYQLPDGSFELFAQTLVSLQPGDARFVAHDNIAGYVRVIDRFTSADGLKWGDRRRVLVQDEKDPVDLQFYYHTVTHTDKGYVGLLGSYHVKDQYMDLEWCFSPDGLNWTRPLRRAWVPRGAEGQPDSYTLYPPNRIVQHDGAWWLFYTGVNYPHNHKGVKGQPASVLMLAKTPSIWAAP